MASNEPVIGAAAVLDTDPDPDEYGLVVRLAGLVGGNAYILTRYDITVPTIYIGYAARGTSAAAVAWTIRRITFVSGNPTISEWTDVGATSWNDRVIAVYS